MDSPGTALEKFVLFDPDKLNDENKTLIIQFLRGVTGVIPQFHRFSFDVDYNDWSAKSCISAVLPEGLLFRFASFL